MKPKYKIHSALASGGGVCESKPTLSKARYSSDRIACFQHDVCSKSIPPEFRLCDCIYVVLPWQSGYKKFVKDTAASDTSFDDYCAGVRRICSILKKPTFLMSGKAMANKLWPDRLHSVYMSDYGFDMAFSVWNFDEKLPCKSDEFLEFLSAKYSCVLDFSCGYGSTGYFFKKAILTDINTGCIDYVVREFSLGAGFDCKTWLNSKA